MVGTEATLQAYPALTAAGTDSFPALCDQPPPLLQASSQGLWLDFLYSEPVLVLVVTVVSLLREVLRKSSP